MLLRIIVAAAAFIFGGYFGSKIKSRKSVNFKKNFACIMLLVSIKIFFIKIILNL